MAPACRTYKGTESWTFAIALQRGRRNMSASAWTKVALVADPHIRAEAEARQKAAGKQGGRPRKNPPTEQENLGVDLRQGFSETDDDGDESLASENGKTAKNEDAEQENLERSSTLKVSENGGPDEAPEREPPKKQRAAARRRGERFRANNVRPSRST